MKERWEIKRLKGKKYEHEYRTIFFSFHFLIPTKICLGVSKWKISTRKSIFHTGKKLGKVTLPTLKNSPLMPLTVLESSARVGQSALPSGS